MNLFINYYNADNRQDQIDCCLEKNLANPLITRIIIFNQHKKIDHQKVISIDSDKRPTYQDFFNKTREYPDDINIIANSDIFFDSTLEKANRLAPHQCYALTRWEFDGKKSTPFHDTHNINNNCPPMYSQDVWMFRGASKLTNCDVVWAVRSNIRIYDLIKFTIGIPGCDNVIAARLKTTYGINNVKNPAHDIKCHHYHVNAIPRAYTHRITGSKNRWGVIKQGKVPITAL